MPTSMITRAMTARLSALEASSGVGLRGVFWLGGIAGTTRMHPSIHVSILTGLCRRLPMPYVFHKMLGVCSFQRPESCPTLANRPCHLVIHHCVPHLLIPTRPPPIMQSWRWPARTARPQPPASSWASHCSPAARGTSARASSPGTTNSGTATTAVPRSRPLRGCWRNTAAWSCPCW